MKRNIIFVALINFSLGAAFGQTAKHLGAKVTFYPTALLRTSQSSDAEKIVAWKGERVILLAKPKGYNDAPFGFGTYGAQLSRNPGKGLTQEYDGKTGTIIESRITNREPELIIALDGSDEKVIVQDVGHLGFFAEKKQAESLVSRTFWTKGKLFLDDPNKALAPVTRLQATRVEWGSYNEPIALYLKTDDGREGPLKFGLWHTLDKRFHLSSLGGEFAENFFTQDPQKLYPRWSADSWKLIKSGMIAIGMTEDMVKAVCGSGLEMTKAVLSSAGKVSYIYMCLDIEDQFLIEGGKVTKYIKP